MTHAQNSPAAPTDLRGLPKDAITKFILTVLQERRPINWDEIDPAYPFETEVDLRMWQAVDALSSLLNRPDGKKRRRLRERATDLLHACDAEARALAEGL